MNASIRTALLLTMLLPGIAGTTLAESRAPETDPTSARPTSDFERGQFHYARGEYRQAADAFLRAAARLEPSRKAEARYWAALSWLGAGEPVQARSAFEDVIASGTARRAAAELGEALAWEVSRRPDRALERLNAALAEDAGEVTPSILARVLALSEARGDHESARRARERLLREWPASMEAAAERLASGAAPPPPPAATSRPARQR